MLVTTVAHCLDRYCRPGNRILVGFSGGPDSLCLLHILYRLQQQYGYTLIAAHLNHGWHDQAATTAAWAAQWCQERSIPCIIGDAATFIHAVVDRGSQEDRGRQLRRAFFAAVAQEQRADYIVLGHHADDQIETMLIRCIRGSSLAGLAGMQECEGLYLRPLLPCRKLAIMHYLHEQQLVYCQDPTNNSDNYLRNRLRHAVIPALQQADARAIDGITRTIEQLRELHSWLASAVEEELQQVTIDSIEHLSLPLLCNRAPVIRRQILLQWFIRQQLPCNPTAAWLAEIDRFIMQPQGGSHQVHPTWRLVKAGKKIRVQRNEPSIKSLS
ncbi:tRNA lysidine(34) synthetase TilS [Candidatus Dependentiae bacterium]|nr:tRNA lysidine(34) synthetase TilS [Candidatus Dependentiae bacterium]